MGRFKGVGGEDVVEGGVLCIERVGFVDEMVYQ